MESEQKRSAGMPKRLERDQSDGLNTVVRVCTNAERKGQTDINDKIGKTGKMSNQLHKAEF